MNTEPIPGYRLIERIGRGGFGEVWKAEAPGGILKAIKLVYGNMETIGEQAEGAEQEYKSINRVKSIRHPFVLSLERFEIVQGQLIIVMELADRSLWDRFLECKKRGLQGIPREELLRYMTEAAEALDLLNIEYQIQHLDIKPQNIFLIHNHIKVADFGLAKDLEGLRSKMTGGVTPTYAPPETFEGWVSRSCDQYSLAIVYQEMLTGARPFQGENTRHLIMQHMTANPDLTSLDPSDRHVIHRALSKQPDDRYPTCAAFVEELKRGNHRTANYVPGSTPTNYLVPQAKSTKAQPAQSTNINKPLSTHSRPLPGLVTVSQKLSTKVAEEAERAKQHFSSSEHFHTNESSEKCYCLAPTIVVGLGGFGLETLVSLKRSIAERFGRSTLPHMRLLGIDTDPGHIEQQTNQLNRYPLNSDEVVHVGLQRPGYYITHSKLSDVERWVPSEILHAIPRNHSTLGYRALGRLAFADHFALILKKIKRFISELSDPKLLEESNKLTGLETRSRDLEICIISSCGGGTGSGMLIDLAYHLKYELYLAGFPASVAGVIALPELTKAATDANVNALLQELSYFCNSSSNYQPKFLRSESNFADDGPPFSRMFFQPYREPENSAKSNGPVATAQLTHSLMFSPIAKTISNNIHPQTVHLVGYRKSIWPRKTIVTMTARDLVDRLLEKWRIAIPNTEDMKEMMASLPKKVGLNQVQIENAIEESIGMALKGNATQYINQTFDMLSQPIGSMIVPESEIISRITMLMGMPISVQLTVPSQLSNWCTESLQAILQSKSKRLSAFFIYVAENPKFRLGGVIQLIQNWDQELQQQVSSIQLEQQAISSILQESSFEVENYILTLLNAKKTTSKKAVEIDAINRIKEWYLAKYRTTILTHVAQFYSTLHNQITDFVRDFKSCQSSLSHFQEVIRTNTITVGALVRPKISDFLLHADATNIAEEINYFAKILPRTTLDELDANIGAKIKADFHSLVNICLKPHEYERSLISLLTDECIKAAEKYVPKETTTQVLTSKLHSRQSIFEQIQELIDQCGIALSSFAMVPSERKTLLGLPFCKDDSVQQAITARLTNTVYHTIAKDDGLIILEDQKTNLNELIRQIRIINEAEEHLGSIPFPHSRYDLRW
ncbi:MAG: tubulin-like doman-containing protein [Zavarzinella sp.]